MRSPISITMPEWLRRRRFALAPCVALAAMAMMGCQSTPHRPSFVIVSPPGAPVRVDGHLDEACYQRPPAAASFTVAGAPEARPQPTRAWLFWEPERLLVAFDVDDSDVVAKPESGHELDVDSQDRVELFLWSGSSGDPYYCLEIGARGAVHDYAARFYRRFDDTWSPSAWSRAVTRKSGGYRVEAGISRSALAAMGFKWQPGIRIRAGLFRADFRSSAPNDPDWLCWVDARGAKPDFHVAASFGEIILRP